MKTITQRLAVARRLRWLRFSIPPLYRPSHTGLSHRPKSLSHLEPAVSHLSGLLLIAHLLLRVGKLLRVRLLMIDWLLCRNEPLWILERLLMLRRNLRLVLLETRRHLLKLISVWALRLHASHRRKRLLKQGIHGRLRRGLLLHLRGLRIREDVDFI